ncbi:uncharacterized protein LOC100830553 [Brachypodium distachyon]|uniref:Myb-like domain-containing protein n=1 Tax=Brachypodium distachyon TaxID=15368 RepID=I1ITP3_BRADI|nr:uncharacterized protein LOC100830553 [Brachypodium distachyon]XP_010238630.1 uncharacterized protein LOC100830553 [Brachypodium distachyon]XP_024310447.1 uncharacterized protein LOC100830553 [Brachypodium distachyon]KQJ91902.1 hypothetical protein BRADI_4g40450v3 [Brachypodium distachyon]KQJ91903.1 hypothetical protein BRADI_4g40450v3 [Brachypodium distachyon]|eukprot:XP_010238629.1 uncharacterized protein LOC100830553 [Brachypodium distachyon]
MLHQENSEVFVRHHSEQLACGNLRGTDDGRSNFLPEKFHVATERNAATCLVNTASTVKEGAVDHNKRPASDGLADMVDWKRMKQGDQTICEKDHHVADADVNVPEYITYRTCEKIFDAPAYESDGSEDEGVDSPVHFSLPHNYEDYIRSAGFYQKEDIFSSLGVCPPSKTVPIGPNYQAELPECASDRKRNSIDDYADLSSSSHVCAGSEAESNKWIGNCIIPMPGSVELSSMPKPVCCKADCRCVDEDSIECVSKHVREARERLMGALGPNTFKELGFCDMGEEVSLRWTEEEEHLFQEVVSSNPASLGRNFWDELLLAFPFKTSKELVSYYFNVFMLRKRAEQNRFDPMNVDSDNDEWQGSDDDEFAVTERADDDLLHESLTDQDDGVFNQVSLERNIHQKSSEEDELDNSGGEMQENCCTERDVMASGLPVMSFVDHNQEATTLDADAQDDSCTSFEAQHIGVANGTPADIPGDHYGDDGFGSVADHGYFGGHCDPKAWDIGFPSVWEKDDFLSTNNVIEEVFGKGSCENENNSSASQGIM